MWSLAGHRSVTALAPGKLQSHDKDVGTQTEAQVQSQHLPQHPQQSDHLSAKRWQREREGEVERGGQGSTHYRFALHFKPHNPNTELFILYIKGLFMLVAICYTHIILKSGD